MLGGRVCGEAEEGAGEPIRLEAVSGHLLSIQKLFIDFEQIRVLLYGNHGGH